MVVKVYISGISGNKEVKKRQQRVLLILDSRNIVYNVIDIAEPTNEEQKDFMQTHSTSSGGTISDPKPRHPLPPQIFNDDEYCGDYDQFEMANEIDEMEKFLKKAPMSEFSKSSNDDDSKLANGELPVEAAVDDDNVVEPPDSNGVTAVDDKAADEETVVVETKSEDVVEDEGVAEDVNDQNDDDDNADGGDE